VRRFLIWSGIIFGIFLIFILAIYLFISALLDTEPYIPESSYLALSISGAIPEYQVPDYLQEQLSGSQMDMKKIRQTLRMAAVDDRIKGVILKTGYIQAGYAKIQEIHQIISEYRDSGKKIFAILDVGLTRDYYLASACDSVFIQPEGILLLTGIAAEVTNYKDLLKKIGVEADFEHIGKYKSYPEMYTRNSMSDNRREVINNILDNRYDELLSQISEQRGIDQKKLQRLIDNISGFTPKEAIEFNLIDGVKHYDDLKMSLTDDENISKVSALEYSRISPSTIGLMGGSTIAVIYCTGSIMGGEGGSDPIFGETMGANRVIRDIKQATRNSYISAIILRINSPGGSAIASEKIWNAVIEAKKEKPVIASISDLGASGGYYIAMAADTILAQRSSLVGSIGVFIGKFSLKELYKKIGINTESVKRGKNSQLFSFTSKFSDSERQVVRKLISDNYNNFVSKVADLRNKNVEQIHKVAQGRVWTGKDGYKFDLIDEIGGLDRAIEIAKEKSDIDASEIVRIVYYPKSKSFLKSLTRTVNFLDNPVKEIEKYCMKYQMQPLRLMPYRIQYH
jgi:protease IV